MYTIDEVSDMLNEIADEIPEVFYNELNGGIVLLEQLKPHPKGFGDLFILGEYSRRHDMGRQIFIYYGSFIRMYGNAPREVMYKQLRDTLLHEFTHHWESLAGEKDLELDDNRRMHEYLLAHHERKQREKKE